MNVDPQNSPLYEKISNSASVRLGGQFAWKATTSARLHMYRRPNLHMVNVGLARRKSLIRVKCVLTEGLVGSHAQNYLHLKVPVVVDGLEIPRVHIKANDQ